MYSLYAVALVIDRNERVRLELAVEELVRRVEYPYKSVYIVAY